MNSAIRNPFVLEPALVNKYQQKNQDPAKTDRETQRIPLPHNSLFVLGLESNMRWLHGINTDKRPMQERLPAENAYGGMRISLTFRHIGTFLSADSSRIWGQGATVKFYPGQATINGIESSSEEMVQAFGTENQSTEFNWDKSYGSGFDVLHLRTEVPERRMLFLGDDEEENEVVKAAVEALGGEKPEIVVPPPKIADVVAGNAAAAAAAAESSKKSGKKKEKVGSGSSDSTETKKGDPLLLLREPRKVCLRDIDNNHTEVEGARNIVLYLNRYL